MNEEFRRLRPDPNLIYPGDRVFVPAPNEKTEPAPTEERTRFRKIGTGARLRFIFDDGDSNPNDDRELTFLCVSNLVTSTNLPDGHGPDPAGAADPDHFKVEIEDPGERGDTIPAARCTLEALKPDGAGGFAQFGTRRTLQVELKRVNDAAGAPTNKFRSRYLRLVTDTVDQAVNADQCLLTDWDPGDANIDILDQRVQIEYERADGSRPKRQLPIGTDRRKIRMAVHVLNRTPGGTPIVAVADAQTRVQKWYRRTYAQANMGPKLMAAVAAVDPPRNMVVVSNNSGANASTPTDANRLRFEIVGPAAGITYDVQPGDTPARIAADHGFAGYATIYNHANNAAHRAARAIDEVRAGDSLFIPAQAGLVVVVYRPRRTQTPISTAREIARRVGTAGYTATAFPNDPRPGDPRGSADVLIKQADGTLVTCQNAGSAGNAQTLTAVAVSTTTFLVSSNNTAGGFASHNIGAPEQRALVRNYRPNAASNRVECFVVGTVQYDDASTTIRGRAVIPSLFRPANEQPKHPFLRSTYMANTTMSACTNTAAGDSSDANPFTFPHESGHVIIDAFHAGVATQMMTGSGTSGANSVGASKRIFDSPVAFGGMGALSPLNQVSRLRSSGSPVLENWPT
jgi:hypothetical protein